MICPKCGAANRPGAKFCDECGLSLKSVVSQPPIPGPQPGMRYRRARHIEATQATPASPKREPVPPPPRREPPSREPKREARPSAIRETVPAPWKHHVSSPENEPMLSAEPFHRRVQPDSDVEITHPEPKRKRDHNHSSGERDNVTVMIVLALVFLAILAVGASGVYFNLRESHPDLLRKEAERADSARNTYQPQPEMARFDMPSLNLPKKPDIASEVSPDPPAVPPIPESIIPQSNPAIPDQAASTPPLDNPAPEPSLAAQLDELQQRELISDIIMDASHDSPQVVAAYSDEDVREMIRKPNTASGRASTTENNKGAYKAEFRQLFGMKVIERTYPSMAMKERALNLWTREQKILEPDGSINDKYAPKRESSPIPGH